MASIKSMTTPVPGDLVYVQTIEHGMRRGVVESVSPNRKVYRVSFTRDHVDMPAEILATRRQVTLVR